ncbi:putative L-alanoyl-D-glutamate peptidase [Bacillus phage BCP8-2]|uniref:Putative L-alanoyl-D-glutamate peptidase n=1 Tax=Bacillus phage BCP8-2 TaxID=1129192 RepID=A0A0E3D983_9CAUD|nr:L-alanyl-D-glutamate peptidase [Bacillus phage BCP8-2]AHJ87049.1 putative L-alanoyl-D-glutamate peptidase [Bacillus phage BCP8-2]
MKLKALITTGALSAGLFLFGQGTASADEVNTDRSIVDYLYHSNQDHSFGHRKQLSETYGIVGYTGTEEQNVRLLTMLKEDRGAVKPKQEQRVAEQSIQANTKPQTPQTKQQAQVQPEPKQSQPQGRTITVEATAYTPHPSENGGTYGGQVLTATGFNLSKNPNARVIAVDPRVIPLGTRVHVEGYGEAVALDTGGAIKGNRIDVLLPTDSQANAWGRKQVKVTILGK